MSIPYFVPRAAWGAAAPKQVGLNFNPRLGGVAVHHTGGSVEARRYHSDCAAHVRGIQRYHMNGEYDDIAYTYLVCKHGYVFEGRGVGRRTGANGTNDANHRFYAVCGLVGGSFGLYDEITPELIYGFRNAIAHLRSVGNAGTAIVRHGQLSSTSCPGQLGSFLSHMEPTSPGKAWAPGPPKPDVPAFPGVVLHYPPTTVHSSARTWQQRMAERGWSIGVDGAYGEQSRRVCLAFQQEKGLTVDGVVGAQTWYAAWTAPVSSGGSNPGAAPDWPGVLFGYPPATTHAGVRTWQQQMAARGWSIGTDGVYGQQSRTVCLAFQREKGLTPDGIVGPATWHAAWAAPVS
ncbi:peptidoglycan recognition protein family protein [Streptomyces sp. enrichment culture]|uniref:peptidoglycan recognition protein family protein n=1 Tax=Streptomyces sp. enrichment culture TaxID=1795815 RepID=UPI003F544AD7